MFAKILGSRAVLSAVVIVVLVAAAALGLVLSRPHPEMRGYCADMPDSVGLYRGSAVTIMGVAVGRVTDISAAGPVARVRFTVPADRPLPTDVGAVTISDTLIADRNLALVGDEPIGGPRWNPGQCITRTVTPKSLTQTFDALSKLADALGPGTDPARRDSIGNGLAALDNATTGMGDQLNTVIRELGRALAAPDAAIGHIGELLDNLSALAQRAHTLWPNIRATATGLTQAFADMNNLAMPPILVLLDALRNTLPQFNDFIVMSGSPALRSLESVRQSPQQIADGVGTLPDILRMTPAVVTSFAAMPDPGTGKFTIGYAPPKLALPQEDTARVCAAVQVLTAHGCQVSEAGAVTIPAVSALLAAVSAK
ncbi:MlaD family protein [Nocardia sp. BMG111209]|uniref:MlaD family protein n=1 Tax=Nocardia sp. BMG111209 TaxID=1160137 RepID=UPI00035C9411|nr:MlaD family protein [Nocardia sp. BMG111209]